MNKQLLLALTLAVCGLSINAAPASKKGFFEQLMTARAYKDDLRLNLFDTAEVNISQSENIVGTSVLSSISAYIIYTAYKLIANPHGTSAQRDIQINMGERLLIVGGVTIPFVLISAYRTLNAEKWMPIQRIAQEDVKDTTIAL